MGVLDECEAQLVKAFGAWDFSTIFPAGYTGQKGVLIVPGYPPEQIGNLEVLTKGSMDKPIISLTATPYQEDTRTFGDLWKVGTGVGGVNQLARRVKARFWVSCWADQQMGASETAKKLGGQVQGCVFWNRNRLTSYRRLCTHQGKERFIDSAMLWGVDLLVEGETLLNVDATVS